MRSEYCIFSFVIAAHTYTDTWRSTEPGRMMVWGMMVKLNGVKITCRFVENMVTQSGIWLAGGCTLFLYGCEGYKLTIGDDNK